MKPKSTIYIVSDSHLGHENIKRYIGRPDNFEQVLLDNLKVIKREDVFIHLGDIAFGNEENWHYLMFQNVPCKRFLTIGNHDHRSFGWYLDHGWDFVSRNFTIDFYGHRIVFSHEQVHGGDFTLNIHGHWHNNEPDEKTMIKGKYALVSMEKSNYKPLKLINIISEFDKATLKYKSIKDEN